MKKSQARKLGFKKIKSVQQAYQILRRELKIYRSKRQSDPAAIISFEHLLKIQPGAWCMIPDRQSMVIEEKYVRDDEMTEGQVEAILREIDSLDAEDLGILTADKPAGEASVEQLRKMADAEDAAGCGLLTTDREPEAKRQTYVEKFLAESKESSEAYRKAEIEYEADHFPDASKKVEPQPAGLREWWVFPSGCNAFPDMAYKSPANGFVHVREVPSPERVRAALDAWARKGKYKGWENVLTTTRIDMLELLRSLGVPTEGV